MRFLALLFALVLPLAACGPTDTDPNPDATQELPDPGTPMDVDPLSRDDGQSSHEAVADEAGTGDDLFNAPIEDETPPADEPDDTM